MTMSSSGSQGRPSPGALPRLEHLDLYVHNGLGSDGRSEYCEVVELPAGRVALIHAEATGRKDEVAQRLTDLGTILHNVLGQASDDVMRSMHEVNGLVYSYCNWRRGFFTLFLGLYEDSTRSVDYINCGHAHPILLRHDGLVERGCVGNIPLGLMASIQFETASLRLAPGDTLIVQSAELEEGFDEWAPLDTPSTGSLIRAIGCLSLPRVAEVLRKVRGELDGALTDDMAILVARGK